MGKLLNWAGNYTYSTDNLHLPRSIEEVQRVVTSHNRVKVLGTRHSFNGIADSTDHLISLHHLDRVLSVDRDRRTVTVEAGITYGNLCKYLNDIGLAIHNIASLPHISVGGACATATHGSGDHNGNLATAVCAMEVVTADGEVVNFSRDPRDPDLNGAVVGLGGIGVVTKLTLDVVPAYQMRQDVYENLPLSELHAQFDDIFSSAYSVSLFTDWQSANFTQVWLKRRLTEEGSIVIRADLFGAKLSDVALHPLQGHAPENCNDQLGITGPWHERLPHFRMDFTPSSGAELQSEYIIPRMHAYDALCAIYQLRTHITPLLLISEVRSIAKDELWMSPNYQQPSIGIHFTWKDDWHAVQNVLPLIEEQLAPFRARPHWGKLFTMKVEQVQSLYDQLPEFQKLLRHYDPQGKFRNAFLHTYIFGSLE